MFGKLLRAGLQSGTIMGIADASTQVLIEGKNITSAMTSLGTKNGEARRSSQDTNDSYDGDRTLRWALMGLLLHGPYFLTGFSAIDRRFGVSKVSWKTVAKKTVTAQMILFPPYLVLLFGFLGVLERDPDIFAKIQTRVPEAFLSGCVYWPVANAVNFKLVPNSLRVPYLALSAGVWNSYLSFTNQRGRRTSNGNKNDI